MNSPSSSQTRMNLTATFNTVSQPANKSSKPQPDNEPEKLVPMSFRVTEDEREQIRIDAGQVAVSSYIRHKLVGDKTLERKPQYTQKQTQPAIDHKTLAQLMGLLGQSELATSLIALALAAQSGTMPVTPELTDKLHTACDAVQDMRVMLIIALNIKVEPGR
ncbi:MAG: hypothetical protein VKJ06_03840 [Vampirovibrionales bacterium]|nr:hypothetical protein [Vampirovibrionales bacterium]